MPWIIKTYLIRWLRHGLRVLIPSVQLTSLRESYNSLPSIKSNILYIYGFENHLELLLKEPYVTLMIDIWSMCVYPKAHATCIWKQTSHYIIVIQKAPQRGKNMDLFFLNFFFIDNLLACHVSWPILKLDEYFGISLSSQ